MNEVEDGFQLGAALQRRAAALLPAPYSASIRSQRLDLGIKVLIDSRGAAGPSHLNTDNFATLDFETSSLDEISKFQF